MASRRKSAKVVYQEGELFPRIGVIVRNLILPNWVAGDFYNKRGRAEQRIKEGS